MARTGGPADALLAAILAAPDDDAPRLVYADWLSERGDPRGELIQVQCELARGAAEGERRSALLARERKLLRQHRKTWAGAAGLARESCEFRRGFIDEVSLSWARLFALEEQLFGSEPVRSLKLQQARPELDRLAASPLLARLRSLDLTSVEIGDAGASLLAVSPGVVGLVELVLVNCGLGLDGARALGDSPHLTGLRSLQVFGNRLEDEGLAALADGPSLRGLRSLDAGWNNVGAAGVKALASSSLRPQSLALAGNRIDGAGLEALCVSPLVARLERLSLDRNRLEERGARAIAALDAPALAFLDLSSTALGNAGAAALAGIARLPALRTLVLRSSQIGNDGVRALVGSDALSGVRALDLSGNLFGATGAKALASSKALARLTELDVSHNVLGDEGALELIDPGALPALARLAIAGAKLDREIAAALRARLGDGFVEG